MGLAGKSAELSLRRGVPQGDGVEPERAFQREAQRPVADHEAWAGSGPSLDVSGVDAAAAGNRGPSLVRSQEGTRCRAWRQGPGGSDAEAGGGLVPGRCRWSDVRRGKDVSRETAEAGQSLSSGSTEGTAPSRLRLHLGPAGVRPRRRRRRSGLGALSFRGNERLYGNRTHYTTEAGKKADPYG